MEKVKDFNEVLKYFENLVLTDFNISSKKLKDVKICCKSSNIDYLLGIDIDRSIKMKQLRTMYLNENKLQEIKNFLYTDLSLFSKDSEQRFTYEFNKVGGKEYSTHHKKGGCLEFITFIIKPFNIEIHIQFRASVVPYNLYFDLIMLRELFDELGFKEPYPSNEDYTYYFYFDEIKGKLMQNFFYYILAGYYDNPDDLLKYEYGKKMLEEYNRAEKSSYHATKRFWGKCNDAMKKRSIEIG